MRFRRQTKEPASPEREVRTYHDYPSRQFDLRNRGRTIIPTGEHLNANPNMPTVAKVHIGALKGDPEDWNTPIVRANTLRIIDTRNLPVANDGTKEVNGRSLPADTMFAVVDYMFDEPVTEESSQSHIVPLQPGAWFEFGCGGVSADGAQRDRSGSLFASAIAPRNNLLLFEVDAEGELAITDPGATNGTTLSVLKPHNPDGSVIESRLPKFEFPIDRHVGRSAISGATAQGSDTV